MNAVTNTFAAPHASPLVTIGIPAIALVVVALIGLAIARASRSESADGKRDAQWFMLGASAWLVLTGMLAARGVYARWDAVPPPAFGLMVPTVLLPIALGMSRIGRNVAKLTPLALLVGFHAFRLPLELVMHEAAADGTMPNQMTYTGLNFDIVTGGSALVVALLAANDLAPRWLIVSWNALGSILLIAIMVIAIASLPLFRAFGDEPAQLNTWVAYFPFVWLPAGLVAAGIFGHIVLWRRLVDSACAPELLSESRSRNATGVAPAHSGA